MTVLAVLMALSMLAGAFGLATQAYAYEQSQVGATGMFNPGGFEVSFMDARLKSYAFTQNKAQNVKAYEGEYLWDEMGSMAAKPRPDSVSIRIPVDAGKSPTLAEGQAALDGVSFEVVFSNLGTYKGRGVQAKIAVSDFKDCLPEQRGNGHPNGFTRADAATKALLGDTNGVGYCFCATASNLVRHEAMTFYGTESEEMSIEYQYEDGTPIILDSADRLLVSISSLDRDGAPGDGGAEGVQLHGALRGWTSSNTSVVRGSLTSGLDGLGLNGSYIDSDASPTYFGTTRDAGYSQWLDKSVTYEADTSNGEARTSFRIIDQVGAIGFPLNATPLTAFVPERPTKSVDKAQASVGDEVTYTISQKVNQTGDSALQSYSYSAWSFADTLDDALGYRSLRVIDGSGTDVTDQGTVGTNGQKVTFSFSDQYLKSMALDGSTYRFVLVAGIRSAHGGQEIPNKATVTFNNDYAQDTNTVVTTVPAKGDIALSKSSALPATTDGNASYSLAGATYGVYSDEACTKLVTTMETDASGHASATGLDARAYHVKEIAASRGYALDDSAYAVEVRPDVATPVNGEAGVVEMPQSDAVDLLLQKKDAETKGAPAQEGLSLAGARYEVTYYPGHYDGAKDAQASGRGLRSWVFVTDDAGRIELSGSRRISGDDLYANSQGAAVLPVGSYVFREIEAPAGYQLGDEPLFAEVTSAGTSEQVDTYTVPLSLEIPIHGQVILSKSSDPADGTKVVPGQRITYTLVLTNGSDVPVEDVAVFDAVPDHASYADGSVSAEDSGTFLRERNAVSWVVPSLGPGEKATMSFAVTASLDAERGLAITNMASWDADHPRLPEEPLPKTSNKVEHVVDISDDPAETPADEDDSLPGSGGADGTGALGKTARLPQTGQTIVSLLLLALGAALSVWGWVRWHDDGGLPPAPKVY
jgi:fimbrial isopeptide formation D2 family protein/uncharacterized repeat protein (TIGR01451 family)